jgi:hypothetical protein
MARSYKRDKNGRFAGSGGGGGKLGKSEKNEGARARYKRSKQNLDAAKDVYGGNAPGAKTKGAKREIGAAKSGLTRTTKNLQGGASRQGSFKDLGKGGAAPKASAPKKAASKKQPSTMKGETGAQMRDRLIREHKPRQNNPKKGTKAYEKDMKETVASRKALSKDLKKINDKYSARRRRAAAKG